MYEIELFPPTRQITTKPLPLSAIGTVTAAKEARITVLALAMHSLDKPADADMWHRRLGHPSYDVVEKMHRKRSSMG